MNRIYLICYDITADRLRAKVSKKIQSFGLDRIQYSVFLGSLSDVQLLRLESMLKQLMFSSKGAGDSLMVFPFTQQQISQYRGLGDQRLDIDYILGTRLTLIL